MADQLELLKQLQTLDGELYKLRRQQDKKPRELEQAEAEVAAQQARVKAADDHMKALQLSQKEKEMDLQTREGNVRKLQGQLFQVKTNKEYSTMQREIDSLKADNSFLEEAILKLFDGIEQAGAERQREQARLAEQQQRFAKERERVEGELAEIEQRITRLELERGRVAPGVEAPTLAFYERILEMREGVALVPLLHNACGGCHRRLPPQVINEVYLKAKLTTCESCSRILYFDEAHSTL